MAAQQKKMKEGLKLQIDGYIPEKGTPRPAYTYRGFRRNHSKLGVKDRDWTGVEAKKGPDLPPLVPIKSKKGEVSYRELW